MTYSTSSTSSAASTKTFAKHTSNSDEPPSTVTPDQTNYWSPPRSQSATSSPWPPLCNPSAYQHSSLVKIGSI